MKLLFDQNLSRRLVDDLADIFPDASHVEIVGLSRAPDQAVWSYARAHGYAIVTKDSDFADLSVLQGAPPKVIWIRIGNCTTADIAALLRRSHDTIVSFAAEVGTASLEIARQ